MDNAEMFYDFDLLTFSSKQVQKKIKDVGVFFDTVKSENKNISLSFSGGKDSTACLLLCLHYGISPKIVWFNSGYEFPETEGYIKGLVNKYNLDLREIKPTEDPLQEKVKAGFFDLEVIQKVNKKILSDWYDTNKEYDCVITGIRQQESKARRMTIGRNGQYFYNKSYNANAFYPVAKFSAKEVFGVIAGFGEMPHPIYHKAETINERDWIRVNWYILTAAENGFYVFLKKHYPEQYKIIVNAVPQIRTYV